MNEIVERLRELIENEGKSCSFDHELITPLYVYRMWGARVAIEEIANAMAALHFDQLGINQTREQVRRAM